MILLLRRVTLLTTPPPPYIYTYIHTLTGHASASYLSGLKYHAPVEGTADDDGPELLAPEHVDGGLLTVIWSAEEGLQVRVCGSFCLVHV